MLRVGEIVEYADHTWRVFKADRQVRTVTLIRGDSTQEEVEDDTAEVKVVCNPALVWPFTTAPIRSERAGRIVKLTRASNPPQVLSLYVDWAPSSHDRSGGSVFFNPKLRLRIGEVISAEHQDGSLSRITITKTFGTMAQRQRRALPKAPAVSSNRFSSLDEDD
jgi:hypothetical protein